MNTVNLIIGFIFGLFCSGVAFIIFYFLSKRVEYVSCDADYKIGIKPCSSKHITKKTYLISIFCDNSDMLSHYLVKPNFKSYLPQDRWEKHHEHLFKGDRLRVSYKKIYSFFNNDVKYVCLDISPFK